MIFVTYLDYTWSILGLYLEHTWIILGAYLDYTWSIIDIMIPEAYYMKAYKNQT
jgi:hypothetical protein